jgi:tetratricopeptide (TPR) repeat protein
MSPGPAQERPPAPPSGLWRTPPRRAAVLALALLGLGFVGGLVAAYYFRPSGPPEADPGYQWQQARRALESGDFVLAKSHLDRCLEAWPANAEAHFLQARTCRRAGDVDGWQRHLHLAERLQWDKADVDLERLLMRVQSGDVWGAEDTLIGYLNSSHPDEVLILEALVKGYLEIYSFSDALEWADVWIKRHPEDDWLPRLYRGRARHLAHALHLAIADYERVLEVKPDRAEAHLWLAAALTLDGRFQEALAHYHVYLPGHPDDPAALLGVAECLFSVGDTTAARAALDDLFARSNDDPGGLLLRAKLELGAGSPREALAWLRRAEAAAPQEVDVNQTLALTFRELGDGAEAEKYQGKVKELDQAYRRVEGMRKEILKDPDNVSLRYEAGVLLLQLGREDEAGRWFRGLLRLDPDHRPTHRALAELFQKQGDARRAEYHRRRAGGEGGEAGKAAP